MEKKVITVTSPLLPSLEEFMPYLQDIALFARHLGA